MNHTFDEHPRRPDIYDPPREQRLEDEDPAACFGAAEISPKILEKEYRKPKDDGLRAAILVLPPALIRRTIKQCLNFLIEMRLNQCAVC